MTQRRDIILVACQQVEADLFDMAETASIFIAGLREGDPAAGSLEFLRGEMLRALDRLLFNVPLLRRPEPKRTHTAGSLRTLREAADFTQTSVAAALNMSQSHYSKLERREVAPSMATAYKLAALFRVSVDELMAVAPTVQGE